jgi:hypothetical protein
MIKEQLNRKTLVNRKKLSMVEHSSACSDGTCAFRNAFYSKILEEKNESIAAYNFHKSRMYTYPYSNAWVISWEHSVKEL